MVTWPIVKVFKRRKDFYIYILPSINLFIFTYCHVAISLVSFYIYILSCINLFSFILLYLIPVTSPPHLTKTMTSYFTRLRTNHGVRRYVRFLLFEFNPVFWSLIYFLYFLIQNADDDKQV